MVYTKETDIQHTFFIPYCIGEKKNIRYTRNKWVKHREKEMDYKDIRTTIIERERGLSEVAEV